MTEHELSEAQVRIADAAIRVIERDGFDVVSVRTVAAESGMSAGTVQYHYRTRQDLLTAALVRSVQRQTSRVDAAASTASAQSPGSYRVTLGGSLRELLPLEGVRHEDAAAWVSFGAAASTRDWLAALYWQVMADFQASLRSVLGQAASDGRLRDGLTPETAATLVTALVNGLTLDHLNAPADVRAGIEDALDAGLRLILTD